MEVAESLEKLRMMARTDEALRQKLLATKQEADPLKSFCRISTNGGGENSPLLEWEDDYYELFLAELRSDV